MKVKLKFTDEHIALIKAMNFGKVDFKEIVNTFSVVDHNVRVVEGESGHEVIIPYRIGDILDRFDIGFDNIYGLDTYNLWGGTFLWEQMAYILGYQGAIVPSTMEDPTGPKFYKTVWTALDDNGRRIVLTDEEKKKSDVVGFEEIDVLEHMKDLDSFIITNLPYIMDILLQFCTEGIQPGVTYWAYDYQRIWHKEE